MVTPRGNKGAAWREIMQGTMPGARRRKGHGQHQNMEGSIRMTEDGDTWRKYVRGVAHPRIEDG